MSASGPPQDDSSPVDVRTGAAALASGKTPKPAGDAVGRDEELARIRELLADARAGRSGALLVEGEPGIGKTTLLRSARSLATEHTVLHATGVASESALAHAGLLELLNPVRHLLDEVPAAQAAALGSALGWTSGEVPADRFLVAAATLSLLAAAAVRHPVLVIVDDLHWLDRESADAILFAARRLGPDAVAVLCAARTSSLPSALTQGLPVLRVVGLSAAAAADLVPADVAPGVLGRLVAGTQGNPLAMLEVSHRLDPAQRVGAAALPEPLPVGERLETFYASLLAELSVDARRAVLLLAITGPATMVTVAATFDGSAGVAGTALDEARELGVVVSDGPALRFRHPLLRTAALRRATPAQRREAHRAVAAALPVEDPSRPWHLAEAAVGADDALADQLARVAAADRQRLGFAAASAALERSALLTRDTQRATERLAAAAEDAFVAGDAVRTRELVDRVLAAAAPEAVRGHVLFTLGMLEQYAGSVPRSAGHFADASELLAGAPLVRTLTELAIARFRLNELAGFAECADRIDAVADLTDPEQRLLASFTGGVALMLRGDTDAGTTRLAEVRALAVSPDLRNDPRALLLLALSAGFSGEVGAAMAVGEARVDEIRRRGALGILVPTLAIVAAGRAWVGDHTGAFADAGEAAELAEQIGYAADAAVAVEMVAWQSAARGMHDDARHALVRARALTDRAGTTGVAAHQALTSAFCALCRGDLGEVVSLLEARLAADGGLGAMGEPLGVAPLLVEAYAGLGRTVDARALAGRFTEITPPSALPLSRAIAGRCRGITAAESSAAVEAFEDALAAHVDAEDPFESARTRFLFGARLRREGQRTAAREQLRIAHEAFTQMDLTLWARQAADELAATGATARRRGPDIEEPLTSQETRVALLVARGLSNREVAAALFLSPKTVERHLSSVFRKRGFRSRTQLAGTYARLAGSGPG